MSMTKALRARLDAGELIEAEYYSQAHDIARFHLGTLPDQPVRCCEHCGVSERHLRFNQMHAALDWRNAPRERLRTDYKGRVYSVRPDLDYIALCASCHKRLDSSGWKTAALAEVSWPV